MPARARNLSIIALTCVMAILLCLVQTASAVAAKSPEKTASGFFFADPNIYTGEILPESQQQQWEITPITTPTASGRQVWLSADPIGEAGGMNLYAYVENDPVNYLDPLGLQCFMAQPTPIIPPSLLRTAIRLNGPGNRVKLPDGRWVDLAGKGHFDKATGEWIRTPHTHDPKPPNPAPYQNRPSGNYSCPRPSTVKDINDSIQFLKNGVLQFFMDFNTPPKLYYPDVKHS